MQNLQGKHIVVGITGGIAAYKTIELVRLLRKAEAQVRVVLTPAAAEFVTPLTLQAVSGNSIAQSLLDPQAELAMGHIELAKWADLVVIAPASADFIARLTVGMANDLLSTLCRCRFRENVRTTRDFGRNSDRTFSQFSYPTRLNKPKCNNYRRSYKRGN